ncbi:MAG: hypothetical protein WEF28_02305, partial [Acidimicrobiia bacterium]
MDDSGEKASQRPIARHTLVAAAVVALLVVACGQPADPPLDPQLVASGAELYQQNCASYHGADLSGDPNWKTRNDDGSCAPPPP